LFFRCFVSIHGFIYAWVFKGGLCSHGHCTNQSTTLGILFWKINDFTTTVEWVTTSICGTCWRGTCKCGGTIGGCGRTI
jgi:hypothetical protein